MFLFCIDSVFFWRQTVEGKCFQIYTWNLGIMVGFFCNFTKSLSFYHLTFRHYWMMKSLPFISKTCILAYFECRSLEFWHQNSSIVYLKYSCTNKHAKTCKNVQKRASQVLIYQKNVQKCAKSCKNVQKRASQIFLDPIQKGAPARSVQLEAVYLEALL